MKKGMILYVTQGKEDVPLHGETDLIEISRSLGVATTCVAITREDVDYGVWKLIAKGVHQVLLTMVTYDAASKNFELQSVPLRLWG